MPSAPAAAPQRTPSTAVVCTVARAVSAFFAPIAAAAVTVTPTESPMNTLTIRLMMVAVAPTALTDAEPPRLPRGEHDRDREQQNLFCKRSLTHVDGFHRHSSFLRQYTRYTDKMQFTNQTLLLHFSNIFS